MDKNSITGIVLMGLILFGFVFFQNKQYQKQAAYQAQLDSIAAVERYRADSAAAADALRDTARLRDLALQGQEAGQVAISQAVLFIRIPFLRLPTLVRRR